MSDIPFEPTLEGERLYVEQRWESFARCARSGAESFGRGVVLVSVRPPHAPDKSGTIEYVSDASAAAYWPDGRWPDATIAQAVAEYDSERGFLVLFVDYERQTCRLHRFEAE